MGRSFKKILVLMSVAGITNSAYALNRLIIKYKPTNTQSHALSTGSLSNNELITQQMIPLTKNTLQRLSTSAGVGIQEVGRVATGAHVVQLQDDVIEPQLQEIIQNIQADSAIEYVVEDKLLLPNSVPSYNLQQWDMQNIATTPTAGWIGNNFVGAWNALNLMGKQAGQGTIVAVIDTGYTPHQNFVSNLVGGSNIYGYQFISDCRISGQCPSSQSTNTNIAYQANGLDLGDFVTQTNINQSNGFFAQSCLQPTSSWHGTHVTGTVIGQGATNNQTVGILGGAYGAQVLPLRVLGKCGGYISDIDNAMLWAAGSTNVPNNIGGYLPQNPTPANVISMSLGGDGTCSAAQQDTINTITGSGLGNNAPIIVVAAGNSAKNISQTNPASCSNVVVVAATGPTNKLAYYSNWGATTITAAGGDKTVNDPTSEIYSTLWGSTQTYESTNTGIYGYYQGTSMATPHVSAAVADILGYLKGSGLNWTYSSIVQVLQNTAGFSYTANSGNCNSAGCVSSGTLNVESAINYLVSTYSKTLVPSQSSLSYTANTASTQTVTFTNNNTSSVKINSVVIANNTSNIFTVSSQSCTGGTIPSGGTCSATVNYSGANVSTTAQLQLISSETAVVSSVNISVTGGSSTPAPTSKSSSSGGGCTAIADGNDSGIMILLILGTLGYLYRKYIYSKKGR